MHDGGARLVVLLLGDPHLLEGRQRGQDGASDPDRVLPLGGSDDLDLHGGGSQGRDLLLHPVGDAGEHGGPAREDSAAVEILSDVNVALEDRVVGGFVHPGGLLSNEGGLEQSLGAPESLVADGEDVSVGQLVRLLQTGAGSSCLHLLLEVQGHVAQLLLDVSHYLPLGCRGQTVATLAQNPHQVVCQHNINTSHKIH